MIEAVLAGIVANQIGGAVGEAASRRKKKTAQGADFPRNWSSGDGIQRRPWREYRESRQRIGEFYTPEYRTQLGGYFRGN